MNIYTGIDQVPSIECAVVSVGTFDGVHGAHRIILEEISRLAKSIGGQSVVITFSSHPRLLIDPDFDIKILTTQQEKNQLLQQIGIDNIVYLDFDQNIAKMSYVDFIDMLSSKMNIAKIAVGYDHSFGKNREGNFFKLNQLAKNHGFDVVEISKQFVGGKDVKSSLIRDAIKQGNILLANQLLGYDYKMELFICSIEEDRISLKMNNSEKLLPCDGIYPINIERNNYFLEIKNGELALLMNDLPLFAKQGEVFVVHFIGNNIKSNGKKI